MTPDLEYAADKAIKKVGEKTLIRFINDISKKMDFKPGLDYQFFETIICQYFDVKTKELYNSNGEAKVVNCRKILCFMLLKHTDMENTAISYLIDITDRTLSRYKSSIFNLISTPQSDPELYKAYEYLNGIFTNKT